MKRLALVALMLMLFGGLAPSSNATCKDCVFDSCTVVGGDFGWRVCTEEVRYRCVLYVPVNGELTCVYYVETTRICKVNSGCVGAH